MTLHAIEIANSRYESATLHALFVDAQARSADVLLRHGADDASELRTLARIVDVPAYVLRGEFGGAL